MHRRESILSAIESTLTGLGATGSNVSRARAYNIGPSRLPHLEIAQGNDVRNTEAETLDEVMRDLAVVISARAQATSNLETLCNQIAVEVYEAMMDDYTLGKSYVHNVVFEGDGAPEIEGGETEQPVARIDMSFTIHYAHSNTSTEA